MKLWSAVRHLDEAWQHIRVCIKNKRDYVVCRICLKECDLVEPGRERSSILREFTRTHYYRHKIGRQFDAKSTIKTPVQPDLPGLPSVATHLLEN